MINPPPGWGDDELSKFLDAVHHNIFATFHNKNNDYLYLSTIDRCFVGIIEHFIDLQHNMSALLSLRSHSAFRSACATALAGQVAETFVLVRSCLEYVAYAHHIAVHVAAENIWLNRHTAPGGVAAVQKEFAFGKVTKSLEAVDQPLSVRLNKLYQRAIDFGAHPNENAMISSLAMENLEDKLTLYQMYLHPGDLAMAHALSSTIQSGICGLRIIERVFPKEFSAAGVECTLAKLQARD